jgi:hypothetical protein
MTDRADAARGILAIPLFTELMDALEAAAINQAVFAKYDDHEARQAHLASVRAIRDLRSSIEIISKEDQSIDRRKAPA